MKKHLPLFFGVLLFCSSLIAKPVSPELARQIAVTFLQGVGCSHANQLIDRSAELDFHQFYLFAADEGGFVLVAADDEVNPILGYSATSRFECKSIPAHVSDWLGRYERQIICKKSSTAPVAPQWQPLRQGQIPQPTNTVEVQPLLTSTWNQLPLYNSLCPADLGNSSGHAVAGCVAIAAAQVMRYWNFPATGYGSNSYAHSSYGVLSAQFDTTAYQWSDMPDSLTSASTPAQIEAVATLVYHAGVAVNMDYSATASNAYGANYGSLYQPSAENALRQHFKYKGSLHSIFRADYTLAMFDSLLMAELVAHRPIIYTGNDSAAGHAFILDGCNTYGQYHVNWGWGGFCDGYYTLGALNPAPGGTGATTSGTYNLNNCAIIGIEPDTLFDPLTPAIVTALANDTLLGSVAGGGTYIGPDTVVQLFATASEGCRFVHWSDGSTQNPRQFVPYGGIYSFTACFERLSGDTLGYCANTNLISLGYNDATTPVYWGIRLPASTLTANHHLMQVQLYINEPGYYTTTIFTGTLANAAHTQAFTASSAEAGTWKTVTLDTPVAVTGDDPLWITFANLDAAYPAAMAFDCGNDDGTLFTSAYYSHRSNYPYTFMIRGIFGEDITPLYSDTLSYCDTSQFVQSIGAGGLLYWGVKFPGTQLIGRSYLSSVQLFVPEAGTYHLIATQGLNGHPATLTPLQSVTYTDSDTGRWHSIDIQSYFPLTPSQPLWIAFLNTDAEHPAAACAKDADTNSSMASLDGFVWRPIYQYESLLQYSWMIRCVTSDTAPAFRCSILGDTLFRTHTSQTFAVAGNRPQASYLWQLLGAEPGTSTDSVVTASWSAPGDYQVLLTASFEGDTVYDTLPVHVYQCDTADLPWFEDFSAPLTECWTLTPYAPNSSYLIGAEKYWQSDRGDLRSHLFCGTAGTASRWAFSPAIQLPADSSCWLHYTYAISTGYYNTAKLCIAIAIASAPAPAAAAARTIRSYRTYSSIAQRADSVDISAYAGQVVYLAFCDSSQYDSDNECILSVDNLSVVVKPTHADPPPQQPDTFTVVLACNDATLGTVSGGGRYAKGDTVVISAQPAYECAFVQWNDSCTDNPRSIVVTSDTLFTACFELRGYPIAIDEVDSAAAIPQVRKILYRNRIYIQRDGVTYDLIGRKATL